MNHLEAMAHQIEDLDGLGLGANYLVVTPLDKQDHQCLQSIEPLCQRFELVRLFDLHLFYVTSPGGLQLIQVAEHLCDGLQELLGDS